ncbi:MAG: hypothetical protein AB7F89_22200, partial [Pirellulaceae bacterium]
EPLRTGFAMACQLRKLHPDQWEIKGYRRLLGNQDTWQAIADGQPATEVESVARRGVAEFLRRRSDFLLYP